MAIREAEVFIKMDLANARTSARFCHEVASIAEAPLTDELRSELAGADDDAEFIGEMVDDATQALETMGLAVLWDAGDVVVWDLRPFTDEEREAFWNELAP